MTTFRKITAVKVCLASSGLPSPILRATMALLPVDSMIASPSTMLTAG